MQHTCNIAAHRGVLLPTCAIRSVALLFGVSPCENTYLKHVVQAGDRAEVTGSSPVGGATREGRSDKVFHTKSGRPSCCLMQHACNMVARPSREGSIMNITSGRAEHPTNEYDPEQHLADLGVPLVERPLDYDGAIGMTHFESGEATYVEVDSGLTLNERRSTLAHEVAHVEHGAPIRWMSVRAERRADRAAAERLIPLEALVEAVKWADSIEELAEELNVTPRMVTTRLQMLTPAEGWRFDRAIPGVGLNSPTRQRRARA